MNTWLLEYHDFRPREEKFRETLFTLGNGHFATRGCSEELAASESHYTGTYLAGGYDRLVTEIEGTTVSSEDLVNWPNWLPLTFRHPEEEWFNLENVDVISFNQGLNIRTGELCRRLHFIDQKKRETKIEYRRFVSMDNPHLAGIKFSIEPINWASTIEIISMIDGSVINEGVKRYEELSKNHLMVMDKKWVDNESFLLDTATRQSKIYLSQAVRTEIFEDSIKLSVVGEKWEMDKKIGYVYKLPVDTKKRIHVEKVMTLFSSKDHACSHPSYESLRLLNRLSSYHDLFNKHAKQWERIWNTCNLELPNNDNENRLLHLHIFHLLQTVSLNSINLDVGVPARGLHGEAYRGHIFWDEMFIMPFLNFRIPELSRSLLMYRYRRLNDARLNAKMLGYSGAMYPWQSGSNGEEVSQRIHINPLSKHWIPDTTFNQRHINAAIVYNIWLYFQTTNDLEFLSSYGIEISLEICRFWISALTFNEEKQRYELKNVVGPDEFHTHYPKSKIAGVHNNFYTNYMASWCIWTSLEMLNSVSETRKKEILNILEISQEQLDDWHKKSIRIFLPFDRNGLMEQFEGASALEDLDWSYYRSKYANIRRIDRILEKEGEDVNDYKVNKQADVLMLYYLFSFEELKEGFKRLGYELDQSHVKSNIDYHLSISTNGSSLSKIVHAWVISHYDKEKSWEWFKNSLEEDFKFSDESTTSEGIHLGAMAGTIDLVQRCFTGIEVRKGILWINPKLPNELSCLKFLIHFRGNSFEINICDKVMSVKVQTSYEESEQINIQGEFFNFKKDDEFLFNLNQQ